MKITTKYTHCCSLFLVKNKKISVILITLSLLFWGQFANNAFAQMATYKVQIGAYKNLNMNNFSNLSSIGTVLTEDAGKGTTRIILGYYNTKAEAEQVLAQVKNLGYTTAFVSTSPKTNATLPPHTPTKKPTQTTTQSTPVKNTPPPPPPPTPANNSITLDPNEELLIEVITYAPNEQIKDADRLNKIFELGDEVFMEAIGANTKVLVGRYPNLKVAQEKQKIIQNMGYPNPILRKVPKLGITTPTTQDPNPIPPPNTNITPELPPNNIGGTHTMPPPQIPQTNVGNQLLPLKLPPNALIVLQNLFRTSTFEVARIGIYNPLDPSAQNTNYQLQGIDLPVGDFAFFSSQNMPQNTETKALYRFTFDNAHEGFLVRHSEKGNYNNNNIINLYVINTQLEQLITIITLSSITNSTPQTQKVSWLMDLDGDEKLDLATLETIHTTNSDNSPNISEILSAKLWQNGEFINAEIDDPQKLKRKLQGE